MELINTEERELAQFCVKEALRLGIEGLRVTLDKGISDTCIMRDGTMDSIQHRLDRSLTFHLYSHGHYGSFSTNRLGRDCLVPFIAKAARTIELMEPDSCKALPPEECMARDAATGYEAGLWDGKYYGTTEEERLAALASMHLNNAAGESWRLISEENEYSDYAVATLVLDSRGYEMMHFESGFSCSSNLTILSEAGERFSSYWWEVSAFKDKINPRRCSETALAKAIESMGPEKAEGGVLNMVVDGNIASRLLSPVSDALSCMSMQQNMSFLNKSKGRKIFSEGMSLRDGAREKGKAGARWFDQSGAATSDLPLIDKGGGVK